MSKGLLYSQIGYDLGDPIRIVVRGPENYVASDAQFVVRNVPSGAEVYTRKAFYWGEKWGSHWWVLSCSGANAPSGGDDNASGSAAALKPGRYEVSIESADGILRGEFDVGLNLIWDATIDKMAISQFEERAALARNGRGWQDCGSDWREVSSHAPAILGLCELVNHGYKYLGPERVGRIQAQIKVGCDFIALCQDAAERTGHPRGAIVHEIPNHMLVIPGEQATAAAALAYAGRLLVDVDPERGADYILRAARTMDYLLSPDSRPFPDQGLSRWNHGAPEEFEKPDEYMTRDLLMMIYAAVNLYAAGVTRFVPDAVRLFEEVERRQVGEDEAEDGLWGHFYTFGRSFGITEKACIHHHVGHDTGAIFPNFITGIIEMIRRLYDHPDVGRWRKLCMNYAYGYLKPACERNPFYLMPEGVFGSEGLLDFAGPWHGTNATYGFAAAVATELEFLTNDPVFRQIATGNLQWVCGLNSGMSAGMFESSVFYKPKLPEDRVIPMSMIYGIGRHYCGCWVDIPGSIMNGFSTNPQFTLTVKPSREIDAPSQFADEDWVPHAGGFLAALSRLRARKVFRFSAESTDHEEA